MLIMKLNDYGSSAGTQIQQFKIIMITKADYVAVFIENLINATISLGEYHNRNWYEKLIFKNLIHK